MKPAYLFIFLVVTIKMYAQKAGTPDFKDLVAFYNGKNVIRAASKPDTKKHLDIKIHFQDALALRYERNRYNVFILTNNLMGELFKQEPVVNESGFHYKANPQFEIEETKGNAGYIKLGVTFQF